MERIHDFRCAPPHPSETVPRTGDRQFIG